MWGKIVLIVLMLIGAILVYGAGKITEKIKFFKEEDKNILAVKVTGLVLVLISAAIVFTRF